MQIPTNEPAAFGINETVEWQRAYGDYPPADGWSLKYYLAGASVFTSPLVADGTNGTWVVTVTPTYTAGKLAGVYQWAAYAEKGSGPTLERRSVASGTLTLAPDITTATAGDFLTHAEKALAVIDAALEGRLTADMQSYVIAGRQVTKIPITELMQLRVRYRSELFRIQNGGKLGPQIRVGFTDPRLTSFPSDQDSQLQRKFPWR